MKKLLLSLFALLLPSMAFAAYSGTPTPKTDFEIDGNCYLIKTVENLYGFAALVNGGETGACGKLMDNIVVNGSETETLTSMLNEDGSVKSGKTVQTWTPIGTETKKFVGTFDGNNKKISGLYFNDANLNYVGLFGYASGGAIIKNVGIVDSYIKGEDYVGGLLGYVDEESSVYIMNCYSAGNVVGNKYVGGLLSYAGENSNAYIMNCYSAGNVVGDKYVGGLLGYVGENSNAYIMNSFAQDGSANVLVGQGTAAKVSSFGFKTEEEFNNGTVAILLHDWCKNDAIGSASAITGVYSDAWGQYVDHDAYPVFSGEIKFDIDYVLNGEDAASDAPETYTYGTGATLKDPTRTGYIFDGWYDNETFSGSAVKTIATDAKGAKTFYAKWVHLALVDGVYEIYDADALYRFAELVNNGQNSINGKLMNDIVVNGSETETLTSMLNEDGSVKSGKTVRVWTPIGGVVNGTKVENLYSGSFNGNGYAVKGLYINDDSEDYLGLFGFVDTDGKVDKVGVGDSYFNGSKYVGGVAGSNDGSITNCYNSGSVNGNSLAFVGGVVGLNKGTVTNCYNMASIKGGDLSSTVGSVVGANFIDGTVTNCFALEGTAEKLVNGTADATSNFKTETEFKNGTLAILLHDWCEKDGNACKTNGKNGLVWGQYVGTGEDHDAYPVLGNGENGTGAVIFDIDYVLNDGDEAEETPKTYTYGTGATLKDPTRTDYTFDGWYDNETFTGSAVTAIATDATGAKKFYAKWVHLALVDNVYEIYDADALYKFADLVNKGQKSINGKLMDDIIVNSDVLNDKGTLNTAPEDGFRPWTPIGTKDHKYAGSFDGNGKSIKGLYFNDDSKNLVGLFGYVHSNGKVEQVRVEDSYFNGDNYVGGVAGENDGSITNSYNSSSVNGSDQIGGIAGKNKGHITNCYNIGHVNGNENIGGVAGFNGEQVSSTTATITNSYNRGNVNGTKTVGGIVGKNNDKIVNSFALDGSADKLVGEGNAADAASGFKTEDEFRDGTVAILLHNWCEKEGSSESCKAGGKNGSTWGQYVGTGVGHDAYPVLGNGENGTGAVIFDIDYVLNDGDAAAYAPETYIYSEGASLKDPTRSGYTFKGWFTSADFEGKTVTSIAADATGAKTFYAKWSDPIPYTITYKNESGATNTNPTSYTAETEEKDLLALTRDGYKFQGWFDGEGDDAIEVKKIGGGKVGDITLYASWSIESYEIKAVANGASMGSVSGAGTYEYGAEVSLVATAAEFYHFTNWQDDADAKATRKVTVAVGGASYVANFAADVYKVTLNADGGTVASELNEYTYGEGATLPLATKDGYSFAGWFASSDANAKEVKKISETDHGDMEFFAKWNAEQSSSSSVETGSSSSALPSDAQESCSSSSEEPASSSSNAEQSSSSSDNAESVIAAAVAPQFSLSVAGRNVQITGARIGSAYAVLDIQGRVIAKGVVAVANFAVEMPGAGSYMVRIGKQLQRVNVK